MPAGKRDKEPWDLLSQAVAVIASMSFFAFVMGYIINVL